MLERDPKGVWLIPGYAGAELRLNSLRIDKPYPIYGRAVIEFEGIRLAILTRDTPPTLRGGMSEWGEPTLFERANTDAPVNVSERPATTITRSSICGLDATSETRAYSRADLANIDPSVGDTKETPLMNFEEWLDSPIPAPQPEDQFHEDTIPGGTPRRNTIRPEAPTQLPRNVTHTIESSKTEELDAYEIRMALERLVRQPEPEAANPVDMLPPAQVFQPVSAPITPQPSSYVQQHPSGNTTTHDATNLDLPMASTAGDFSATTEQPIIDKRQEATFSQTPVTTSPETAYDVPCVQFPRSSETTSNGSRRQPLLETLGLLTKRHPVSVIGGAAIGSMFIVVFMVGVAHLLGSGTKSEATKAMRKSAPIATTATEIRKLSAPSAQPPLVPVVASTSPTASAFTESVIPGNDPAVTIATGHLFAGRLAEAESAYSELAIRHPEVPSYSIVARILTRRNSANCGSASETKKLCPTVKQ
jgi:hypothetical protein